MKLTQKEKADRYDALVYAIDYEKKAYEKQLKEIDGEIDRANETVGAMLIGRKYTYKEFVDQLERWC